jgi:hypothetical protein
MPDRFPVRTSRLSTALVPRATSRQLAAIEQGELFTRAVVAAETRIARARVESIVDVTESAMLGASEIASVQGCLIGGTPWAARPIALIAETGYSGLRQIVHRHAHGDR